jgi:predicted nucleic acid-binding protein
MTAAVFADTNVLVYAVDAGERVKQPLARAWMEHLWRTDSGRTSVQVMQEYYVTVTRKLEPGLHPSVAQQQVRRLLTWDPQVIDGSLLEIAWGVEARLRLSWWDSLIVAAAHRQRCSHLLTEDLADGLKFEGVLVIDPFVHSPAEVLGG